jgi:pimeloyl-ACP methyl ester carboxylesterase
MTLQLLACHALIGGADAAALSVDFCGYTTHYVKRTPSPSSSPPNPVPVVLVHGFGGSSGQWRASLDDLAASGRTVYAIDLLGFGASEKPQLPPYRRANLAYSIELWAAQLQEFVDDVVVAQDGAPGAIVVGNSIGSLTCVAAAAGAGLQLTKAEPSTRASAPSSIMGVGLFNCAIGMNSKASPLPTDPFWYALFFALATPIFALLDALLRSPLAPLLFDKVRSEAFVRDALTNGVYVNSERVDEALVSLITAPAEDEGALETFIEILSGDPGPRPESLVPRIDPATPIACWWGTEDTVTPLAGVVGQYFKRLPTERAGGGAAEFRLLDGTGHCPFDDRPDLASPVLIEWLDRIGC